MVLNKYLRGSAMSKYNGLDIDRRALLFAEYVLETGATVRATAKHFGFSKSTVHKDLSFRLKSLFPGLYEEVSAVLAVNKKERHIRGGLATRQKYLEARRRKIG